MNEFPQVKIKDRLQLLGKARIVEVFPDSVKLIPITAHAPHHKVFYVADSKNFVADSSCRVKKEVGQYGYYVYQANGSEGWFEFHPLNSLIYSEYEAELQKEIKRCQK